MAQIAIKEYSVSRALLPKLGKFTLCYAEVHIISAFASLCERAHLVNINFALTQLNFSLFNLLLELGVCLGDVVESEDRDT